MTSSDLARMAWAGLMAETWDMPSGPRYRPPVKHDYKQGRAARKARRKRQQQARRKNR